MSSVARRFLSVLLPMAIVVPAHGANINSEWNTGNGAWNVAANWSPVDVPDNGAGRLYYVQIGNRPVAAGAVVTYFPEDNPNDIVSSLTVTNGAELFTNSRHLNVFGQTTVEGADSKIRIGPHDNPHASAFFTHNLNLVDGGVLVVSGGAVEVRDLIEVNDGATLQGPGEVFAGGIVLRQGSNVITSGMLHLEASTAQIDAGAMFSGGGSLHVSAGGELRLDDNASVGLFVENQGELSIGLDAAAQGFAISYNQAASGSWIVDLHGSGPDEFDQLTLAGSAQLAGAIQLALGGGYAPTPGDTFNILSAGGVTGQFAPIVQPPGMPAGLVFDVRYDPTFVQLVVVNAVPGDYNRDGAADAADYIVWRKMLGQNVPMFTSADGNGDGMVTPEDIDVWRAHFGTNSLAGAGGDTAIPEPTAFVLALLASVTYLFIKP